MSTVTGGTVSRGRVALRVAVTDRAVVGALAAFCAVLAAVTWRTWGDPGSDTGYDFVASQRFADGEIPYQDFPYFYGPLAPAVGALAVLLGGNDVAAFTGLGLVIALAIVGVTYAVARLLAGPPAAGAAAAITAALAFAPTNFSFVLPHTYSATLGLLGALVFVLGAGRATLGGGRAWIWTAGAGAAVTALARPEFTLAVWLAGAAWFAVSARVGAVTRRDLAALLTSAAGIPLIVYGAFAALTSPGALLFDNLYPRDQLAAGAGDVLSISAPMTAGSFAELAGRLAVYAAGVAGMLLVARMIASGGTRRTAGLAIAGAAGVVALAALAVRPELVRHGLQFAYGWIPAGAALAVGILVWRNRARRDGWDAAARLELLLAVLLTVIAARSYAAFFAHSTVPQQAVYAIPFAAVLLAWLHDRELGTSPAARRIGVAFLAFLALAGAVLAATDARDESGLVQGPGGTLTERPLTAAAYQGALDVILRETAPGDPVLLAPQLTSLYTLSGRTDPLPQISLLPGSLPGPADEQEAVRRLDAAGVDLIVVNTRALTEYGQGSFGRTFNLGLQDWLERDFTRVASLGTDGETTVALDVWQRSNPS